MKELLLDYCFSYLLSRQQYMPCGPNKNLEKSLNAWKAKRSGDLNKSYQERSPLWNLACLLRIMNDKSDKHYRRGFSQQKV